MNRFENVAKKNGYSKPVFKKQASRFYNYGTPSPTKENVPYLILLS